MYWAYPDGWTHSIKRVIKLTKKERYLPIGSVKLCIGKKPMLMITCFVNLYCYMWSLSNRSWLSRSKRKQLSPGPWFNIKMSNYQYRKFYYGDKTILRPSHLNNGISYTGKMTSLYWIGTQIPITSHRWPSYSEEIRRSYDRRISTMGFPILVRWHLHIESGTRFLLHRIDGRVIVRRLQGAALREDFIQHTTVECGD